MRAGWLKKMGPTASRVLDARDDRSSVVQCRLAVKHSQLPCPMACFSYAVRLTLVRKDRAVPPPLSMNW